MKESWRTYHERTKDKPPSRYLVEGLKFIEKRERALDLGAGALVDSVFLVESGFDSVDAVDSDPNVISLAKEIGQDKIKVHAIAFDEFDFPKDYYQIVHARASLPFNSPETISAVISKIKDSLEAGGIFIGDFFGINDEWSNNKNMNFQTREELVGYLDGMDIISIEEIDKNGPLASGAEKHWHIFHVTAKKKLT